MYLTDLPQHMIYEYDFDPAIGAIENRRPFIHTPDEHGIPDGLAVDSEGFIWTTLSEEQNKSSQALVTSFT